jgi:putative ABC transport system permease protein
MTGNIVHVLINVLCLGLALAICMVAYLNYRFDADFDTCHENRDRIFRIEHTRLTEGGPQSFASTPVPLGPAVINDISGVEKMVRITMDLMSNVQLLQAGEDEVYTRLIYADPDFFDVFNFPFVKGAGESFRNNPSIYITEHLATVLFGDKDPVGEIITVWDSPYTVTGILENHPLNSSFSFQAVVPVYNFFHREGPSEYSWNDQVSSTFILVRDPRQAKTIEKSLQRYLPVVNDVSWSRVEGFYLAPFSDMAHKGRKIRGHPFNPSVHPAAVFPPLIAAICILLIACFNFTNTSIAVAGKRLKEIGIRKAMGGSRRQLIQQLLGENLLLVILALVFALFFARFLLPAYSNMWDFVELSYSITRDPELWGFIILALVVTAFLSGAYPAIYISSFNPVMIFQDKLMLGRSNIISKGILALQYSISVLALFTGAAFIENSEYLESFDMGYDADHLYEVHGENDNLELYRNAVQSNPDIVSVSKSMPGPFFKSRNIRYNETKFEANLHLLDLESFSTVGLRLTEGRPFEAETRKTDEMSSILVNRKFTEESGIDEPLGKTVMMSDTVPLTNIGVIENLLDEGAFTSAIPPIFYRLADENEKAGALCVRTAPENRQEVVEYLKVEWNRLVPDRPFLGVEGDIYKDVSNYINKKILTIALLLVIIAVIISAAGLYSQISLRIIFRTKEIGIRKVFGASIIDVMNTMNYEFLVILAVGSMVGITAGYFLNVALMEAVWEHFTRLTAGTFIVPVIIVVFISVITVSGKVYRAATRDPVRSLRYE